MNWKNGTEADLPAILLLAAQAQAFMKANGLNQWQNGYPTAENFLEDIRKGGCRLLWQGDRLCGMCAVLAERDPSYDVIDGKWLQNETYGSMHRCAVSLEFRGKGIAGILFENGCRELKEKGLPACRIDTHPDNLPMQSALRKAGFVRCGLIRLASGPEKGQVRVGYEKLL